MTLDARADYLQPTIIGVVNGALDISHGEPITVNAYDPNLIPGFKLAVLVTRQPATGPASSDSTEPESIPENKTLSFSLPNGWLGAPGDRASVSYVMIDRIVPIDRPPRTIGYSTEVTLRIVSNSTPPPTDGQLTAERLNARYRDTAPSCPGNKPAYYCNGIVIRSTENGAYDPWNPSPAAERLGGVSFSYMRLDAHVTGLYHNSGFILQPQASVKAPQVAPQYLCIYAYDAGTLVGARGDKGCALKARSLGSCTSVGVSTPAQWYAYTQTLANRDYQCSLSTDDPVQFQTSLTVRANRPANMEALWNEVMIADWGQNKGATLPMEAIFYNGSAVEEAKVFQRKLKERNNVWLPIIKLDLNQLNGSPFSYASADQAVQP